MDNTKLELAEAMAQAQRHLDSVAYYLRDAKDTDLDAAYDMADRLLTAIGHARILEANLIRQTIAQGKNHE